MFRSVRSLSTFSALLLAFCALSANARAEASSKAEAVQVDKRFPAIPLDELSQDQKEQFVRVADSELCPCKNSTDSLSTCLEASDGTCIQARDAARTLFRGVQRHQTDAALSKSIADALKQATQRTAFALENAPAQGAENPRVTMVVFADFECPYCKRMAQIADRLLRAFPDDLRVYFLHFPLASHSNATDAALAAVAAQNQQKFWPYHDKLFEQQQELSKAMDATPLLHQWAKELGLDLDKFQRDIDDPQTYERVRAQQQSGRAANVRGTPAVFLNGVAFSEIGSESALRAHIQSLIEEHTP